MLSLRSCITFLSRTESKEIDAASCARPMSSGAVPCAPNPKRGLPALRSDLPLDSPPALLRLYAHSRIGLGSANPSRPISRGVEAARSGGLTKGNARERTRALGAGSKAGREERGLARAGLGRGMRGARAVSPDSLRLPGWGYELRPLIFFSNFFLNVKLPKSL